MAIRSVPIPAWRTIISTRLTGLLCLMLCFLFQGCASNPNGAGDQQAPQEEVSDYWSHSMTIKAERSTIALFDPLDLNLHAAEPANWYLHDFAFANDLETGRLVTFLTNGEDNVQLRVTSSPLTDRERAAAGPHSVMRLRILNNRLFIGSAISLPSIENTSRIDPYDPGWLVISNGDYKVTMTALDQSDVTLHDYIVQIEAVDSIASVKRAPGIPQLIYGQQLGMAGINAKGVNFRERCSDVKHTAEWSPLLTPQLPIPGAFRRVVVPNKLHKRGRLKMTAGHSSTIPIVISRNPTEDVIGVYLEPSDWTSEVRTFSGDATVNSVISCAVKITGVDLSNDFFKLKVTPMPISFDRLPSQLRRDIKDRFDHWIRLSGDSAWSYKSAMIERAVDDRSLVLGILQYMKLSAKETEKLLTMTNEARAQALYQRMGDNISGS